MEPDAKTSRANYTTSTKSQKARKPKNQKITVKSSKSKQPKIQPQILWAICYQNTITPNIENTMEIAVNEFMDNFGAGFDWEYLMAQGYSVHKIKVTPID